MSQVKRQVWYLRRCGARLPNREGTHTYQIKGDIASSSSVPLANIQVICSDITEHQRQVETRTVDILGLIPPTWESVQAHEYESWDEAPFCMDTALITSTQAVAMTVKEFLPSE